MKVVIEYTDGFEKFHTEIGEKEESTEIDSLKKSIECLEEQYNELIQKFSELKELMLESSSQSIDDDIIRKHKNDGHISTYKHFDNYRVPRKYDVENNRFFISKNRPSIHLDFTQLVAIINAYKSGLPTKKMTNNPILSKYSIYNLQNYIYIWRAGGFNQAIKTHAREFGYNPNKLLSNEVK